VPVWHEGTAKWVKDGKLVLLGITQELHPDRCRLLAQWKGFGWPVLHDPINIMGSAAVPILVAIDEHGIVRDTRPRLDRFESDFLNKTFADDARAVEPVWQTPMLPKDRDRPDFDALRKRAETDRTPTAWRRLGDALTLWGGDSQVNAALDAYARALELAPNDGPTVFRLGVCHRRRYESASRQPGDFQAAINHWGRALELDPNQYIWRRRIQQYGPRLDKPYPFYDWVEQAEKAIRGRSEKPIALAVRPDGAEIAHPIRSFAEDPARDRAPDPDGKVSRDKVGRVQAEVTVVPARVRPGQSARIHVVLRVDANQKTHWNNEAEALRLWIDPPEGWQVAERILTAAAGPKAVSGEARALEFEVKAPANAMGKVRLTAYSLYHVCDDDGGQCLYLRLDIPVELNFAD
jgi:tetratricopeptide (TPR) repeat protein